MKKKVSLLLCVLVMVFGFVGCSDANKVSEDDKAMLEAYSDAIIQSFANLEEKDFDYFRDSSDFWLNNYLAVEINFPADAETFITLINSWEGAEDECGEYKSHGDYKIEATSDGFSVSTEAKYKDRNATIIFSYDENYYLESMDVSAQYGMGEILGKAGMNTVLGMGTVFGVLIFLAFLISLMKYIPVAMDLVKKLKKKEGKQEENVSTVAETTAVETVDVTDDLELVAVITAAIAAQEGTSTDGFVVRSIKRRPSNNWN